MSELARRVIGRAPRGEHGPEPLRVELRLQDPADEVPLAGYVHEALTGLLAGLGVERRPAVEVSGERLAAPWLVSASLDGRPVAHVADDGVASEEATGSLLGRRVVTGVLRRLPLLAGDSRSAVGCYLLGLGCAPGEDGVAPAPSGRSVAEAAEAALDERSDQRIELGVSAATLRRAGPREQRAVARLREQELSRFGAMYPDVHVEPTDEPPGTVRMRLNDVTLPLRDLGESARWRDVVELMAAEVGVRRHWFIRVRQVSSRLDADLAYLLPDLVTVTDANYSRAALTACLRELLRSGRRIRNLPRILWLLLEQGEPAGTPDMLRLAESPLQPKSRHAPRADTDPRLLAAQVRKLGNEEAWRLGNYRMPQGAVRLAAATEEALVASSGSSHARAEWAAVHALAASPGTERVITRSVDAIAPVSDALQALPRPPRVTASQELPPDADLGQFRVLEEPGRDVVP